MARVDAFICCPGRGKKEEEKSVCPQGLFPIRKARFSRNAPALDASAIAGIILTADKVLQSPPAGNCWANSLKRDSANRHHLI
jgi:hypothetical protein